MSSSSRTVAHAAGENKHTAMPTATLAHELEKLCKPYVDAFFIDIAHRQGVVPQASLQQRDTANSSGASALHGFPAKKGLHGTSTTPTFSTPEALLQECSQLMEEAAYPEHVRSAVALEVENAYLRALLSRVLQQQQPSVDAVVQEAATSAEPSLRPSAQLSPQRRTHVDESEARRSPSAAYPGPAAHAGGSADAVHHAVTGHTTTAVDLREASPATALQVGELQEQIELLREAVRGLSQQASMARANSATPLPADARAPLPPFRAVSPSPRCATPTCTTDVPTLQRIILHQQQTISTLRLEMEEVEAAKVRMEQLLNLHAAAATADAAEVNADATTSREEEDDTPCFAATTNWRSTCQTEDRPSELTATQVQPYGVITRASATDASHDNADHNGSTHTAADELYRMDFDAAAEAASEKRRAATYGGVQPLPWLGPALSTDEPIFLTGVEGEVEDEEAEMCDDAPSSGMRTPLPRGTVVLRPLHQRFSSATGDSTSLTGGLTAESPVMRPTKVSYGTLSNRHTSVMGSFNAT
ncbi:hypothetical protein ABB37_01779 [Leptomonas pyrrhocoris]|uniref:Uncharacterized protein n=1 Tax=Leptomonas pyrrhocoris TaxID=157538 RepID=A0A0N0DZN3_LEPPY|nr:hypothetical protein ABB37_01779 [Leptomonas pyrrhocoris]XP_015663929.1 hypothetical protein ABB37_01779 [Leptomonas pyrrhocoris]XP_015663930.1 hypothetical protein ABB37_01779 [Leptomonas pyrrhocoris]KPA85489.1 hypothetical protein ABB37_01779 [Leptomonas pyrrhocoris]KPA85490.1 hypothetical protein ABB37_01779 [Leptomonas pyrrhocoris]KPA85491.1 hypothetical protein ABB37_01779 [Leptomonas pyrrhocoris]|eukprot:XP_015663928.1 hypothetical protein ABB37_01779 [Leptomonas pyrrhocoris]